MHTWESIKTWTTTGLFIHSLCFCFCLYVFPLFLYLCLCVFLSLSFCAWHSHTHTNTHTELNTVIYTHTLSSFHSIFRVFDTQLIKPTWNSASGDFVNFSFSSASFAAICNFVYMWWERGRERSEWQRKAQSEWESQGMNHDGGLFSFGGSQRTGTGTMWENPSLILHHTLTDPMHLHSHLLCSSSQ